MGLRNVLVHAYHRIQPDLLWNAAVDILAVVAVLLRDAPADASPKGWTPASVLASNDGRCRRATSTCTLR